MKILKLFDVNNGSRWAIVDEIPQITYEKIGCNYVGSAINKNGDILFSEFLKYDSYCNAHAFGGRELSLKMKDGTILKIKNNWYDAGHYKPHGNFIHTALNTLDSLQKCYVYCGYNINETAWQNMIDEYYSHEKLYENKETEEWCNLQHKWYKIVMNGLTLPFMVNQHENFVETESKKRVFPKTVIRVNTKNPYKYKLIYTFKLSYQQNGKTIRIEQNYNEILKNSLPTEIYQKIIESREQ